MQVDGITVAFLLATAMAPLIVWADPHASAKRRAAVALAVPVLALLVLLDFGAIASGVFAVAHLTVAAGLGGVLALRIRGGLPEVRVWELGLLVGLVFLGAGGTWLLVYGTGSSLLGFSGGWALLASAHGHAAGFGALTITALIARLSPGPLTTTLVALHPLGFGLVASGITGIPGLELAGTVVYVTIFVIQFGVVLRLRRPLLIVACAVPLLTLSLALNWALGFRQLDLFQMAWFHGLVNAIGHVGLGAVALIRSRGAS